MAVYRGGAGTDRTAAFLHYITESLLKKTTIPSCAAVSLCLVLAVFGAIGIATADSEKPGKMDELAAHLEEQQKMLEELEQGELGSGTSSKARCRAELSRAVP